jgi:hypothetical protein
LAYKGRFIPKNPSKYRGDPTKIIYRSLWELKVFRECDAHPDVIWWQSEEIAIPYRVSWEPPNKTHRYFPDIVMCKKTGQDVTETIMIEIKPHKQTLPPDKSRKNATPTGRTSRRYLNEVKTYGVNSAKWEAAEAYCRARGWKFEKITEKDLF